MKSLPTFKFLAYLSLIDCLHIVTGIPHIISITYGDYDFRNTSNFLCSFHTFLTIYSSHLSSNVLAAVGVFRCTELTSFKTKITRNQNLSRIDRNISSNQSAYIVYSSNRIKLHQRLLDGCGKVEIIMLIIILIIFIFDSHFLILMRLSPDLYQNITDNSTSNYVCYPSFETNAYYFFFYTVVWPWIDLFLYSYIPFTVMMTSTIVIIYKLYNANKNLKYRSHEDTKEIGRKKTFKRKNGTKKSKCIVEAAKRRKQRNSQVYRLLLSLNAMFFVLVTPIVFFNSIKLINRNDETILELVYVLAYLNHCVNFVFYGFTCELFRITLSEKFGCRSQPNTFRDNDCNTIDQIKSKI